MKLLRYFVLVAALLTTPAYAGSPVTVNDPTNTYTLKIDGSGAHFVCDSGCATPVASTHVQTSALASNLVVKASAGSLQSFNIAADSTLSGAAWWVMIFDAASAPADGAVTPTNCYPIASGTTTVGGTYNLAFTTGIVIVVSTTGCFTKTASAHAFIGAGYQ